MAEHTRETIYQEVTDRIIAELEAGRLPWVQPWGTPRAKAGLGLPRNARTERTYSGISILILWGEVIAKGYACQNWLTFRQAISGDSPPWRPVRAFDDGSKVFIEFPGRIDQGEAPPLFVVSPAGDNQLVNYRVRRNYYIVDRLFAAAELRLGTDPQEVVRVSRTDAVSDGVMSDAGPRPDR